MSKQEHNDYEKNNAVDSQPLLNNHHDVVYEYVADNDDSKQASIRKTIISVLTVILLIVCGVLACLLAKETIAVPDGGSSGGHTYTVRFVEPEHGEIAGSGEYKSKDRATVTAVPYVGYDFKGWYKQVDGEAGVEYKKVSSDEKYKFDVSSDIVLKAKFVKSDSADKEK